MLHSITRTLLKPLLLALACAALCAPAFAQADADGMALTESTQLGGRSLRLNGAGICSHLVFKVYAMGLYLQDPKATTQDVLASPGPRRMLIAMLRDVRSEVFEEKVTRFVATDSGTLQANTAAHMLALGRALASLPQGLRKGDTLTLDWVPGTGAVIALNQKPLGAPITDIAFYNALLNIWLGDHPADPALKVKLLGSPGPLRTAAAAM